MRRNTITRYSKNHVGSIILTILTLMLTFAAFVFFDTGKTYHSGCSTQITMHTQEKVHASANAPFTPIIHGSGTGTRLPVIDTFNASINNSQYGLVGGLNNTIPILAPANLSGLPPTAHGNISAVRVQLNAGDDPNVEIPWNSSVAKENKSMHQEWIAQSFFVPAISYIKNISFFGRVFDHLAGGLYDVNVSIFRGAPVLDDLIMSESWMARAFGNSPLEWKNFTLPSTELDPGVYSASIEIERSPLTVLGNFNLTIVNDTGDISEIAYVHNGTDWETIDGDFSIRVGLRNSAKEALEIAEIRGQVDDSTWKNFTGPDYQLQFNESDGGPWLPSPNLFGIIPYFGTPFRIFTNVSFEVNVTMEIHFERSGRLSNTTYFLDNQLSSIHWNASYNATIPEFDNPAINGTAYDLHLDATNHEFKLTIPSRWDGLNATQPGTIAFGDVDEALISNLSLYQGKIWQFEAKSPFMPFTVELNGSEFLHGDDIEISCMLSENFSGGFQGNASAWKNETTMYWQVLEGFTGDNITFTTPFNADNSTELPAGFYSIAVMLTNGTDLGINSSTLSLKYPASAYLATNRSSKDIGGKCNTSLEIPLFLEANDTGAGISGATVNTTWGDEGNAWSWVPGAIDGEYIISLNTNETFCVPGIPKNITISFTSPEMRTTEIQLTVHPWINASLNVTQFPVMIHVNQSIPLDFNYTSHLGDDLSTAGLENLTIEYYIGDYSSQELGFPILPNPGSSFAMNINTSAIPVTSKAGDWDFNFSIQLRLDNGTWYEPITFMESFTILPLDTDLSIVRLDATVNDSLHTLSVGEFEQWNQLHVVEITVQKRVFIYENSSIWKNATGLTISMDINGTVFQLDESNITTGLYSGSVNLSRFQLPGNHVIDIIITGNDIQAKIVELEIQVIEKYSLILELDNPIDELIEEDIYTLSFTVTYVNRLGATLPLANENVTVHLDVYDGTLHITWTEMHVTTNQGRITIEGIDIPKVDNGAYVSMHVEVPGDKTIDNNDLNAITIPVVKSFWGRHGITIGFAIAIGAIAILFFLKKGIPMIKLKKEQKKIALIRDLKPVEREATPHDIKREINVTDMEDMKASTSMSFIHMGPDELLDIDIPAGEFTQPSKKKGWKEKLTGKSSDRERVILKRSSNLDSMAAASSKSSTASKPVTKTLKMKRTGKEGMNKPGADHHIQTSWDLNKNERDASLKRAKALEEAGNIEEALKFYRRAKTFAEKLNATRSMEQIEEKIRKLEIRSRW
ncbi:hypothetical protein GF325_01705 [Candidatus Bathyarchaeota archaeon]|nr:hypothetical protein [Candidatus Bathyarchaeota archaeon]